MFLRRKYLLKTVFCVLITGNILFAESHSNSDRGIYDHVFQVTAKISFDGQIIEIDDLIDCRTNYTGPPERAVTLPFETSRWQLPYETEDGGLLVINIMPNTCAAYQEEWAGIPNADTVFPDDWVPFMHWYDKRDPHEASTGEYYWSQAGLEMETGRLRIVEAFQILYPDQTDETVALAAQQAVEREVWINDGPRVISALLLSASPVYLRLPREVWAREPDYRAAPNRAADVEGLRTFLDQLPEGDGLVFLGEDIVANEAWAFSIGDHLWGRKGGRDNGWHGVPQRGKPKWAMFLSDRSFERAKENPDHIAFKDEWVPTELMNGILTLRPEKTGVLILTSEYGDWYREGERSFNFMGKEVLNGPYTSLSSLYVFDLETRDLWVQD